MTIRTITCTGQCIDIGPCSVPTSQGYKIGLICVCVLVELFEIDTQLGLYVNTLSQRII